MLDTLPREDAYRALVRRKRLVLRQARIAVRTWGAFPFLLRRGYDLLARTVRASGEQEIRGPLDAWATLANGRGKGGIVDAGSLRPRFSEHADQQTHEPIWYGDADDDPADGLQVQFGVLQAGARGKAGRPQQYGFRARFARAGRPLTIEQSGTSALLDETFRTAREAQERREAEVAIIAEAHQRLVAAGSPLAPRIVPWARRVLRVARVGGKVVGVVLLAIATMLLVTFALPLPRLHAAVLRWLRPIGVIMLPGVGRVDISAPPGVVIAKVVDLGASPIMDTPEHGFVFGPMQPVIQPYRLAGDSSDTVRLYVRTAPMERTERIALNVWWGDGTKLEVPPSQMQVVAADGERAMVVAMVHHRYTHLAILGQNRVLVEVGAARGSRYVTIARYVKRVTTE